MKHATDSQLIEFAAGLLSAAEKEEVNNHIRTCAQCRDRLERFQQTWQQMGKWEVETGSRDITDRVQAVTRERSKGTSGRTDKANSVLVLLRAAAAIVLAFIIGHVAGRLSLSASHQELLVKTVQASVSDSLCLEIFTERTPANLAEQVCSSEIPD